MWLSDEEYVYRQDIKEKKSAGRGAYHKKNGSKSKKCNFPSDYLTKKEKMAMNGECISYDMKKFYTYAEFKTFPDDIQLRYINGLINRYNVTISAIAEDLFHITPTGFYKHLKKKDLMQYINKAPNGKSSIAIEGRARLMIAIENANKPTEEVAPEPVIEEPAASEPIPEMITPELVVEEPVEPKVFANFSSMRIEMNDWDSDILDFLRTRFAGGDYRITITVDKDS